LHSRSVEILQGHLCAFQQLCGDQLGQWHGTYKSNRALHQVPNE
jgi:hypothetical protein